MSTTTPQSVPPEAWSPLIRAARLAARPLERFLRIEAASAFFFVVGLVTADEAESSTAQ